MKREDYELALWMIVFFIVAIFMFVTMICIATAHRFDRLENIVYEQTKGRG